MFFFIVLDEKIWLSNGPSQPADDGEEAAHITTAVSLSDLIRLIHEFSITGSIARQPLRMADQACNCWYFLLVEAQWLSGRMPDSRSRERRHESPTHWRR